MKRRTIRLLCACLIAAVWSVWAKPQTGPDPLFEKPAPVTRAEIAKRSTRGVSALEVNDYAPGHYTGALTPSPPHADMNARKAIVVFCITNGVPGQKFRPNGCGPLPVNIICSYASWTTS